MDQWTSKSVNLLFRQDERDPVVQIRANHVTDRNGADVFENYCQCVEFLASQNDLQDAFGGDGKLTPEEVEMRMFSYGGRNPGAWRDYVRRNY